MAEQAHPSRALQPRPRRPASDALTDLLQAPAPRALRAHVTNPDPDLDPDGRYARMLTKIPSPGYTSLGRNCVPAKDRFWNGVGRDSAGPDR